MKFLLEVVITELHFLHCYEFHSSVRLVSFCKFLSLFGSFYLKNSCEQDIKVKQQTIQVKDP